MRRLWMLAFVMASGCFLSKSDSDNDDDDDDNTGLLDGPGTGEESDADADTDTDTGREPDVAGRYNAIVEWVSGCDGDPAWVEDWASGALVVTATGSSVVLDFGDDMILDGTIDKMADISVSGDAVYNGAEMDMSASGAFVSEVTELDSDQWVLSLEFEITLDFDGLDSTNCTLNSEIMAYELVT